MHAQFHWSQYDDNDFVGFKSLRALGIYGMDHQRERIGYKEIRVQAPSSSSNRSPWFFNVPGVKHQHARGYLWVSNHFTSSWVGNTVSQKCLGQVWYRASDLTRVSIILANYIYTPGCEQQSFIIAIKYILSIQLIHVVNDPWNKIHMTTLW